MGTGAGSFDAPDQIVGAEHSQQVEHHKQETNQDSGVHLDLEEGVAYFQPRRTPDEINSARPQE